MTKFTLIKIFLFHNHLQKMDFNKICVDIELQGNELLKKIKLRHEIAKKSSTNVDKAILKTSVKFAESL